MNTKDVFNETGRLGNEINKIHKLLGKINQKCLDIMEICPHEIVFKYNDDHPRKMIIDGSYFCPACAKTIKCIHKSDIKESSFKNSRIIPLTNLSIIRSGDVYHAIRNEVYENMELYYNKSIPNEELSKKMEEILVDKQTKYERPEKVLKKLVKDNND